MLARYHEHDPCKQQKHPDPEKGAHESARDDPVLIMSCVRIHNNAMIRIWVIPPMVRRRRLGMVRVLIGVTHCWVMGGTPGYLCIRGGCLSILGYPRS